MADGCLAVVSGCQWLSACGLIHVFVYSEARSPESCILLTLARLLWEASVVSSE